MENVVRRKEKGRRRDKKMFIKGSPGRWTSCLGLKCSKCEKEPANQMHPGSAYERSSMKALLPGQRRVEKSKTNAFDVFRFGLDIQQKKRSCPFCFWSCTWWTGSSTTCCFRPSMENHTINEGITHPALLFGASATPLISKRPFYNLANSAFPRL